MAFQAKVIHVCPQPLQTLSRVLGMADEAALFEYGPMEKSFLDSGLREIGMASQAKLDRPSPGLVREGAGVRTMASRAIAGDHGCVLCLPFLQTLLHVRVAG